MTIQNTIFEACSDVADRLGLENLTSVVGSTNGTARRLLAKAKESAIALSRRHDWQTLRTEVTFTTVATEDQGALSSLADDFDRFVNETIWNRTRSRALVGPYTPREWQAMKASLSISVATDNFTIRGDRFIISPAPAAGETVAYEYISNATISEDDGSTWTLSEFNADTDLFKLDAEMWKLDIIWRYRSSRGLSYAEEFRSAELMIADRIAHDDPKRRTQMGSGTVIKKPRPPTIPDGNWTL